MKKWLKKYFIPHQENEHKPHFLRMETSLILLSVILFIEILFLVQVFVLFPNFKFLSSILPIVLVDLTNSDRQNSNQTSLVVSPLLEKAAALKAQDMATKSYFSHTSPEGKTPWYWFEQVGYKYIYAGENLAVNFFDSQDVETAWMNSPGHRQNIENPNYTEIGIASARGIYKGKETIFVVQLFGTPAQAKTVVLNNAPTPTTQKPAQNPVAVSNQPQNQPTSSPEKNVEGISGVQSEVKSEAQENDNSESAPPVQTNQKYSSFFQRIISTPRAVVNYIYIVLATIIALALVLTIFIKINIQHPHLIINGVVLLLIIGSVLAVNQYAILFLGQIN